MNKTVTISKLRLENFKGHSLEVSFTDKTEIRGTNGAGKSMLFDAFLWLLIGVDAQDRTNFNLYDNSKEFTHENAIPAVVEGEFLIGEQKYVFKRTAKQKWIRPRGKSEYVKDKSDEYLFYIDDLAVSAKNYRSTIDELIAPVDKLKMMLNVRYYQTLDWRMLRKHFADMVGVISDSELKGDYSAIDELLEKYNHSVESVKEKLRQEINPLKRTNENIEAEIKGMTSMLPDLDGVDEAESLISEKRQRITEIDNEILGLGDANKPFVEKRDKELADIKAKKLDLEKAEKEWNDEQFAKCKSLQSKIADIDKNNADIEKENAKIESQRKSYESQIEMAQQQAKFQSEELDRLRKENADIKARTFDENQVCQTCGQVLPYDKVSEMKEAFYNKREADHKACVERGIRVKENLAKQNEMIESMKQSLKNLPASKPVMSKDSLLVELDEANESTVPFEQSDIYGILSKQLEYMESHVTVVPEINSTELIAEKKKLNDEVAELSAIVAKKAERERGEKQIEGKESERKSIGHELARLEGLFDKCVEREREWASIVRDRANKYLSYCHVEMVEISKAGEMTEFCTLTANDVNAEGTNTASQVLIGIDVANAFQKNAGLQLPIFIDNAEQVVESNIPEMKNQTISLFVDDDYKKLTVI